MLEPVYLLTYVLTIVGFCTLAAILLVPIYRFLKREEARNQREYQRRPAGRPSGMSRSAGASERRSEAANGDG